MKDSMFIQVTCSVDRNFTKMISSFDYFENFQNIFISITLDIKFLGEKNYEKRLLVKLVTTKTYRTDQ